MRRGSPLAQTQGNTWPGSQNARAQTAPQRWFALEMSLRFYTLYKRRYYINIYFETNAFVIETLDLQPGWYITLKACSYEMRADFNYYVYLPKILDNYTLWLFFILVIVVVTIGITIKLWHFRDPSHFFPKDRGHRKVASHFPDCDSAPANPLHSNQEPRAQKPRLTRHLPEFGSSDWQNASQNRCLSPFPRRPVNHVEVGDWAGMRWSWLPDREISLPVPALSVASEL